ncbi:hypothetical protein ACLOJK_012701 [Asimina triloba]
MDSRNTIHFLGLSPELRDRSTRSCNTIAGGNSPRQPITIVVGAHARESNSKNPIYGMGMEIEKIDTSVFVRMASHGSSCGACKFLRRKCIHGCIFAPYFCYDDAVAHFAAIHKIFGASNVSKLLSHLPVHCRSEAAVTISYEAQARIRDPIYGCVAHIFALQRQVANLQEEIQQLITQGEHPAAAQVASYGSTQAMSSLGDFPSSTRQYDPTNFRSLSDQQVPLNLNSVGIFDGDTNPDLPALQGEALYQWEHRSCNEFASDISSLERLCLDADHGIIQNDPWFANAIDP